MSDESGFKMWKISSKVYIMPSISPKRIPSFAFSVARCC